MKTLLLFLSIVLLIQCTKSEKEFYITPELQTYYDDFITAAKLHGVEILNDNLVMTVEADVVSNYGGYGITRVHKGQIYIYIDKDYFDKRGSLIEMVVFHELGHAKLNIPNHNNDYSLMNPAVSQSDWSCLNCKEFLINELFDRAKK